MVKNLIWNDIKQNRLSSAAAIFFMAVSAMLLSLAMLLAWGLLGAIDGLMERAEVPDYMQMHGGDVDITALSVFAGDHGEIREWQVCGFLNLDNSRIVLGGRSLADSTQDNGLCLQGEKFDFLLDMENKKPEVLPGEVYVPACYRLRYDLRAGDSMEIGDRRLRIAGFLRDGQMNSMMASSKRFLVHADDYEAVKTGGNAREEYLIEFLLRREADTAAFGAAYVAAGLPANGPAITKALVRMMNALSDGTMICVIFLLGIVVLLISMLCIRFLLLLQMERDRREVGMLKALGIGKREIRQLYFAKYLLFSGCGALAGLTASFLLKVPLARQLQELYGIMDGGLRSEAMALVAVVAVEGILLLTIGRTLKKMEKLSVLEALFSGTAASGSDRVGLIGFVAAACTLLVLIPRNLYTTMSDSGFVTYMGIGNSEIRMDVRQSERIDEVTDRIAQALGRDARVERYAVLRTKACPVLLEDGGTAILTVETGDHGIFPVSCLEGELPEGPGEMALSAMNAEELGAGVGSTLRLLEQGKTVDYRMCGIYSDITNGGKTAKACSAGEGLPAQWSVLYVSLEEGTASESWMEQYRKMGADVIALEAYVKETYGQTLGQILLASRVAAGIGMMVIVIVAALFMRLLVERNRHAISLHKALGFTGADLRRAWFLRGIVPVAVGICAGLAGGNLLGEALCGVVLKSFGADSFRFVTDWTGMLAGITGILAGPAVLAVLAGISEISQVKACECCMGRD